MKKHLIALAFLSAPTFAFAAPNTIHFQGEVTDQTCSVTINGNAGQKILQPGTVMAKITSGGDSGKIGPFSAAATDGRQTAANIVGINTTFLPWQLIERDVEVAVAYECTAVQAWCYEYNGSNAVITLTNTTADACRGVKGLDIHFK